MPKSLIEGCFFFLSIFKGVFHCQLEEPRALSTRARTSISFTRQFPALFPKDWRAINKISSRFSPIFLARL